MNLKTIIFGVIMIITGTTNTIFNDQMSGSDKYNYYHGFFTSWVMFIGEAIPLYILQITLLTNKKKKEEHYKNQIIESKKNEKSTSAANWKIGFGAIFDCIGSTLISFSLIFLDASVNLIGRAGIIVIVALYSYFWLKIKYNLTQILGLVIIIIGIGLVFLSSILNTNSENNKNNNNKSTSSQQGMAIIFLILSWIIQGFQMVYQEKMLMKYEIDVYRYVGLEGIYGIFFTSIILTFLSFIKCPKGFDICVPGYDIDNVSTGITELYHNPGLFIYTILFCLSIGIYNLVGLKMTQDISSLFRMIMDNARSITVWIFGLITGIEKWRKYSYLQAIGFVIFVFGSMLYQEMISFGKNNKKISFAKNSNSLRRSSLNYSKR